MTVMGRLRSLAHLVAVVVTVAWLLPAVLTFLPSPASAEEQALYSDIMKSRCVDMNGDGVPDPGVPAHGAHDCCTICAAPQPLLPRMAAQVPISFDAPRSETTRPTPDLSFAVPPSEAVFQPVSQRGPPA